MNRFYGLMFRANSAADTYESLIREGMRVYRERMGKEATYATVPLEATVKETPGITVQRSGLVWGMNVVIGQQVE